MKVHRILSIIGTAAPCFCGACFAIKAFSLSSTYELRDNLVILSVTLIVLGIVGLLSVLLSKKAAPTIAIGLHVFRIIIAAGFLLFVAPLPIVQTDHLGRWGLYATHIIEGLSLLWTPVTIAYQGFQAVDPLVLLKQGALFLVVSLSIYSVIIAIIDSILWIQKLRETNITKRPHTG